MKIAQIVRVYLKILDLLLVVIGEKKRANRQQRDYWGFGKIYEEMNGEIFKALIESIKISGTDVFFYLLQKSVQVFYLCFLSFGMNDAIFFQL